MTDEASETVSGNTGSTSEAQDWDIRFGRVLRVIAMIGAIAGCMVVAGTILLFIYTTGLLSWQDLIKDHFMATFGLIGASVTSFGVVVFLRQTEGPMEFEALGAKFQGAAGQVVLWAFCTSVLSLCMKLLW